MNTKEVKGAKVLSKMPDYLSGEAYTPKDKVIEFGSLSEYKKFMIMHKDFDDCNKLASMKRDSWSGSNDYEHFLDILDNGDEAVMKKMKIATDKEVATLEKKYEEELKGYKFDVTGQFFDVGLVLSGVPEVWLEPEFEEVPKVQVELIIDGAFHVKFDQKKIVKSGSRILGIAKVLEEKGVEVKIRIVTGNHKYKSGEPNSTLYVSTLIKDYDEPINYKKVSALLSPTYHRRGTFKAMEVIAEHKVGYGYGYPKDSKGFIQLNNEYAIDALERRVFTK